MGVGADVGGVLVGDDAGDADVGAQIEPGLAFGGGAGETVDDEFELGKIFHDGQAVGVGFADVENDGEVAAGGDFELVEEEAALQQLGGKIVMVVQAAFAEGNDLGMGAEQGFEEGFVAFFGFGGVVRVDAEGGEDFGVLRGDFEGGGVIGNLGADGDAAGDAGGARGGEDSRDVFGQAGEGEVAVGVDKHGGDYSGDEWGFE